MLHRVRFRERVFIEAPPPENDGYCAKLNDHEHRHSRCCNIFFLPSFQIITWRMKGYAFSRVNKCGQMVVTDN